MPSLLDASGTQDGLARRSMGELPEYVDDL
jgi:hypothetical protein